jgi:hypothetical protein
MDLSVHGKHAYNSLYDHYETVILKDFDDCIFKQLQFYPYLATHLFYLTIWIILSIIILETSIKIISNVFYYC